MAEPVVKKIVIAAPLGETTQPKESADEWTPDSGITPPEDLEQLAKLTTVSRLRRSCIEAVVQNTVGLGWSLVPIEGQEEVPDEDDIAELAKQLDSLARRDRRLKRPSFKKLLKTAKWDEQEVGNGYIEVSRNRVTGKIDGLFHVPGKRIRRKADDSGWVMGPRSGSLGEATHFYDFGEKVQYDDNGQPLPRLKQAGMVWDRNELIAFQLYTSESREYGLPCDVNLATDYAGDKLSAESNLSFFGSDGVPPTVFFIGMDSTDDGEDVELEISPSTIQAIANTMAPQQGRQKTVAVIPKPTGSSVDKFDLAQRSDRDMGFVDYRKDNRRAVLGAWRLAPIFVADIEDTNYSTAETERKLTKEQRFDPEQEEWEDQLAQTLLRELAPGLAIKFTELNIADEKVEADAADRAAAKGLITNGEYRDRQNLPPLTEAAEGQGPGLGEVPFGWNAKLVEVKAAGAAPSGLASGIETAARLVAEAQGNGNGAGG